MGMNLNAVVKEKARSLGRKFPSASRRCFCFVVSIRIARENRIVNKRKEMANPKAIPSKVMGNPDKRWVLPKG